MTKPREKKREELQAEMIRVRALCRGLVGTERKPLASLSDRHWRLCRNKGLHPLRRLRGYSEARRKAASEYAKKHSTIGKIQQGELAKTQDS